MKCKNCKNKCICATCIHLLNYYIICICEKTGDAHLTGDKMNLVCITYEEDWIRALKLGVKNE